MPVVTTAVKGGEDVVMRPAYGLGGGRIRTVYESVRIRLVAPT